MDKNFHKEFPTCPNCGSDQRFCEQLGMEAKEKGQARKEWTFYYETRKGLVMDTVNQPNLLVGTTLPGFLIHMDICMDCGTFYAIFIARIEGQTKAVSMPKPGGGLAPNDPRYS